MVRNICLLMCCDTLCLVGVAGDVLGFWIVAHMGESYDFKTLDPSHLSLFLYFSWLSFF